MADLGLGRVDVLEPRETKRDAGVVVALLRDADGLVERRRREPRVAEAEVEAREVQRGIPAARALASAA